MRRTVVVILLAACGNNGAQPRCAVNEPCAMIDAPEISIDAPFTGDPLIGAGSATVVDMGYTFTEGPQWRDATGDLVFSDIPESTIFRYNPTGGSIMIERMPSGNANGLALDANGDLIAAQHGTRSVTRNGTDIVSTYMGNQLNSPNDVIVTSKGIYFTDPPYGLPGGQNNSATGFMGVYFLPTSGALVAAHMGALSERPNGIGISPDGNSVYVADTADGRVYTFAVNTDGTLQPRTMFAMTAGGPDGLAIDAAGNLFVTSNAGIEVFAPSGTKWGTITVPMKPTNCAFGDADHKTLYITTPANLYKVRLVNAGLPRN